MVRTPRREHAVDEGFTLVEVLAAMVVLVVISTATVALLNVALNAVRENTDRVKAATLARTKIDALRASGATAIPLGLVRESAAAPDQRFTVSTTSSWVGIGQQTSSCSPWSQVRTAASSCRTKWRPGR